MAHADLSEICGRLAEEAKDKQMSDFFEVLQNIVSGEDSPTNECADSSQNSQAKELCALLQQQPTKAGVQP